MRQPCQSRLERDDQQTVEVDHHPSHMLLILLQQLLEPARSWIKCPSLWGIVGGAARVEGSEKVTPGPLVVVDGGPEVRGENGVPEPVDL